ncbi:imm11 family protein [Enterovibrio calviensis]|uniref:imm11 family protein n=1 Tax=Enterovibrio calviensis TaxID=91359 RepID=UPI000482EC2F|nr:DUF1629 domain-containing protein [Enterovibrio calviensis]
MAIELNSDPHFPLRETRFSSEEDVNKVHTLSLILKELNYNAKRAVRIAGKNRLYAQIDILSKPLSDEEVDLLPKKIVSLSNEMIYDYEGWRCNLSLITESLKKSIEDIEPHGGHQFIPVEIFNTESKKLGDAFFWKILNVVDAIRLDSGGIEPVSGVEIMENSALTYTYTENINLYADRVLGKAAWYDMRLGASKIISDSLLDLIKKNDFSNIKVMSGKVLIEK